MKVLLINSVCGIRSTGRIVAQLAEDFICSGNECRIAYGREEAPEKLREISYRIGSELGVKANVALARIFDNEGFNAKLATKHFLNWANSYNPDVLWLHNLHGYYLNIEMLFAWIKTRPQMQVKWTLHDCWSFTGHCSYFSFVECDRWKHGCGECDQTHKYPTSLGFDSSKNNYRRKKRAFCGVKNMTLITPSYWLANLVGQSFLKEYPIEVCYNTIDTKVFTPTTSNFREKYNLNNRKIVLGVASTWDERKGLADFIKLSEVLQSKFAIVLVGISPNDVKKCPENIIGIPPTNSVGELVEIYSVADVFVNPSKEETFGLTTLEAMACGTPAIVYKNTACEEIANLYGGIAVEQSINALKNAIEQLT